MPWYTKTTMFPYLTYLNLTSVTDELFDAMVPCSKGIIESLAAFEKAESIAVLEYTLVVSALALILLYF